MVVRAADQLQWDVGETRHYGSAAVVRSTTAGSTGNGSAYGGDDDRPPGLHHLTARVYPPPLDYCVGATASSGHQLYCRTPCGCDTYAAAADYVTASTAVGNRRRVHDRDCSPRLRAVAVPASGADASSIYSGSAPAKRRRHEAAVDATANGRQQVDGPQGSEALARGTTGRYSAPSDDATQPAPTTSATGGSYTVPELVTDCSLASMSSSNNHSVQGGMASRSVYSHSSS